MDVPNPMVQPTPPSSGKIVPHPPSDWKGGTDNGKPAEQAGQGKNVTWRAKAQQQADDEAEGKRPPVALVRDSRQALLSWPWKGPGRPAIPYQLEPAPVVTAPRYLAGTMKKKPVLEEEPLSHLSGRMQLLSNQAQRLLDRHHSENAQREAKAQEMLDTCNYAKKHRSQQALEAPPGSIEMLDPDRAGEPDVSSTSIAPPQQPVAPNGKPGQAVHGGRQLRVAGAGAAGGAEGASGAATHRGRLESKGTAEGPPGPAHHSSIRWKDDMGMARKVGDLDRVEPDLRWVGRLVKFTEENPIFVPDASASAIEREEGGLWRTTVFPAAQPVKREHTQMLEKWLNAMLTELSLEQVNAEEGPKVRFAAGERGDHEVPELDSVLWIYRVAFEELQKQVGLHCVERGQLLRELWQHFFVLVELRARLYYERYLEHAFGELQTVNDDRQRLEQDLSKSIVQVQQTVVEREEEIRRLERGRTHLVQQTMTAQAAAKEANRQLQDVNQQLVQEMGVRFEREKALDESRQLNLRQEERIAELEERLRATADHRDRLEGDVAGKAEEISALKADNGRQAGEIIQLTTDKVELGQSLEESRQEVTSLIEEKLKAGERIKVLFNNNEGLKADVASLGKENRELYGDLAKLREERDVLKEDLSVKTGAKMAVDMMYGKLKSSHAKLKEQHALVEEENDRLLKLTSETRAEREALEQQWETRNTELAAALAASKTQESRYKVAAGTVEAELAELRRLLQLADALLQDPNVRLNQARAAETPDKWEDLDISEEQEAEWKELGAFGKMQGTVRGMHEKLVALLAALDESLKQREVSMHRFNVEEAARLAMEQKVYEEKVRCERLARDLRAAQQSAQESEDGIIDATGKIEKLNKTVIELNDKISSFERQKEKTDRELQQMHELQSSNMNLQTNIQELRSARAGLQQEKELVESNIVNMQQEMEKECEKNEQLQATIKGLLVNIQTTNNSLQEQERANTRLLEQCVKADKELEDTKSQLSTIDSKHQTVVDDLQERIAVLTKAEEKLTRKLAQSQQSLMMAKFFLTGLSAPKQENKEEEKPKEPPKEAARARFSRKARQASVLGGAAKAIEGEKPEPPKEEVNEAKEMLDLLEEKKEEPEEDDEPFHKYPVIPRAAAMLQVAVLSGAAKKQRKLVMERLRSEAEVLEWTKECMESMTVELVDECDAQKQMILALKEQVAKFRMEMRDMKVHMVANGKRNQANFQRLKEWQTKFEERLDSATGSSDLTTAALTHLIGRLPTNISLNPNMADKTQISSIIIKIYSRRLEATLTAFSEAERLTTDTIYQPIIDVFSAMHEKLRLSGIETKVRDFLVSCKGHADDDVKIDTFCKFVGIHWQETLSVKHYHFYFECLDCIRRLLGAGWYDIVSEWEEGRAALSMEVVLDVVANLYNTSHPETVFVVGDTLVKLVKDTKVGPSIDLDVFLSVLMKEFGNMQLPVFPLYNPRRVDSRFAANKAIAAPPQQEQQQQRSAFKGASRATMFAARVSSNVHVGPRG